MMLLSRLCKIISILVFGVTLLGALFLTPAGIFADSTSSGSKRIIVGVTDFPPFSQKTTDGQWVGLSVELWDMIASDLEVQYELREYERLKQINNAILDKQIDLTTKMSVTEHNETTMDLSHAYYQSGIGIAVSSKTTSASWYKSLGQIVSVDSLKLIGMLLLLSLISGVAIWLAERTHNREMFNREFSKGLINGIWWALVTMTTVGYGDKAPRTFAGRCIAVLWMFFSIFLIANYTAVVSSSLTVQELDGRVKGPRDLPNAMIGALNNSETSKFLAEKGLAVVQFETINKGLMAVANQKIDAFVDDELQLKFLIKQHFPGQLHVLPETITEYYVSMAMPEGSHLRERLNRALPKIMDQQVWFSIRQRHIGADR